MLYRFSPIIPYFHPIFALNFLSIFVSIRIMNICRSIEVLREFIKIGIGMNQFVMLGCLWLGACVTAFSQQQTNGVNYQLDPMPSVHKPLAENSVPMGNLEFAESLVWWA